jgi:hypothetical protein
MVVAQAFADRYPVNAEYRRVVEIDHCSLLSLGWGTSPMRTTSINAVQLRPHRDGVASAGARPAITIRRHDGLSHRGQ